MCRRIRQLLFAALAVVLFGVPADGRAGDGISEISGEAADHYRRGQQLYSEGKYEESARELRRAYDRASYPLLLYNIALAEWRAGRLVRALETASRAEDVGLPQGIVPKNRALVRGLETRLRAAEVADRAARAAASADASSATTSSPAASDNAPTSSSTDGLGAGGWTGIGLTTAGLGALGGALWVDRRMATKFDSYRRAARNRRLDEYNRLNRELKQQRTTGLVLLGTGAVATGVGAYLLLHHGLGSGGTRPARTRNSRLPRMRLAPSAGPDHLGAMLRIRWTPFSR